MTTAKSVGDLHRELELYYSAGGHTRSEMAKAVLIEHGFRFERNGAVLVAYWPDGKRVEMSDDGNFIYRDWTAPAKCAARVREARGWVVRPLSDRERRSYRKRDCRNAAASGSRFCHKHNPA